MVAADIEGYGDAPIVLDAWFPDKFDAGGQHPVAGRLKVVDPQQEPDASGDLIPNRVSLILAPSARASRMPVSAP